MRETCACLTRLMTTLKPEYAAILESVDLGGRPLAGAARDLGITSNNASVRLHRARRALRQRVQQSCGTCATHGCLDCDCRN
jgi:RNA polymerase sigma-70 factor (ECF subfamily)